MKIISANSPYFAPFPGFFLKAMHAHVMVIMDSVQFPRGSTWLTRNRFKNDQGTLWLTVPIWRKGQGFQKNNEVQICYDRPWAKKCLSGLKSAYAHAPFFEAHYDFLEKVFSARFERIVDLNKTLLEYALDCLDIPVKVVLLSELRIHAKEPALSVEVCEKLGATHFLAQRRAAKYLDPLLFGAAGVDLLLLPCRPVVYPQLWGDFIPNLSVFDMLFNCGPETRRIIHDSQPKKPSFRSFN